MLIPQIVILLLGKYQHHFKYVYNYLIGFRPNDPYSCSVNMMGNLGKTKVEYSNGQPIFFNITGI